MATKRISKRSVDALQCPPGRDRIFLWDDALSGFGVAAMPSGSKIYYAQFRQHGRSRRMKLGEHGRITPDEARSEAKKVLGAVEQGKDLIAERQAKRQVRTLGDVAADYLRLHVAAKKKPRTNELYELLLRLHILPALGSRIITGIGKADVARLHMSMADRPSAANRCLGLITAIWNWAARQGEIPNLPCPTAGIEPNPETSHERFLTREELKRLGKAMRDAETVGLPWEGDEDGPHAKHLRKKENRIRVIDPHAVAAIRLLMLTGARLREILHARWEYFDRSRGIMFLPDSKSGKKPLYLSDAVLGVLSGIAAVDGNPFIIPGFKEGKPRADLKKPWSAIVRAAGLVKQIEKKGPDGKSLKAKDGKVIMELRATVRLHDLRHTFASTGVGSSLGLPIIGKLLGQSQESTTARYAHLDAAPMHRAANMIGEHIASALNESFSESKEKAITASKPAG